MFETVGRHDGDIVGDPEYIAVVYSHRDADVRCKLCLVQGIFGACGGCDAVVDQQQPFNEQDVGVAAVFHCYEIY